MDVKFLQGTQTDYDNLGTWDEGTFYYTGENVYLGTILLSNDPQIQLALQAITENSDALQDLEDKLGDLEDLDTTSKSDIVSAINEIFVAIGTGGTNAVVSIEESSSEDYAKIYTVYQGGSYIGTINIPKDMVVKSGDVEINPTGQEPGTYIVLTLANDEETKIYVDVADLVNIYTAAPNATQVQIVVEGTELSAYIIAGSVGTTELADGAVTSDKIADGNITSDKLSQTVQEALENAEDAITSVEPGSTNGTISVNGTDVTITGLGSAAYEDKDAFDETGAAASALQEAKEYADNLLVWQVY